MITFSIHNFGCRVNQAEAFLWAEELQKGGMRFEERYEDSELVVVNSCTLTSRAERDVRKFLKQISRLNPGAKIVLTGCLVERSRNELQANPQIWKLISNTEKDELVKKVLSSITSVREQKREVYSYRSRALIKIQDGCNFSCAFCIIPVVRGKSRSKSPGEIISRALELSAKGYREIVLTGIHLCSYGTDLRPKSSLLELLRKLEQERELGKLRLSSLDPRFLTLPLLEHMTSSSSICNHFHLSLQHASDGVLRRMRRRISADRYRKILSFLRHRSPSSSLGADIIVGFPGESEKDFESLHRFLENSPLTYFHVFSYSPRPGTPAASLPQLESRVKKERGAQLRSLSRKKNINFRRKFLGKKLDGIVIRKEGERAEVLTSNYIKVFLPRCPYDEREAVSVRVRKVTSEETLGEIC
ncbi:MAG: tRNA (N(6)-L-threonylcarbamoyladenosine(37)-C(2))-methylthiotransferase MtaB [Candidatus Aminicenantales bacterium]